jgi:hypothetical protein
LDLAVLVEHLIPKYAAFQIRPLLFAFHVLFKELYANSSETFLPAVVRALDVAMSRVSIKANAVGNYFTLLDWVSQVAGISSVQMLGGNKEEGTQGLCIAYY